VTNAPDFFTLARPGAILRTRDRREARIGSVNAAEGLIHGEVAMVGPCRWRLDGRFADAPAGAAGPLDLVAQPVLPAEAPKRRSMIEALADPDSRNFCCD